MEEITLLEIGLFVLNVLLSFMLGFFIGERLGFRDCYALFSSKKTQGNLVVPLPPSKSNPSPQQTGGLEVKTIYPNENNPLAPPVVETGKKQNINEYLGV